LCFVLELEQNTAQGALMLGFVMPLK